MRSLRRDECWANTAWWYISLCPSTTRTSWDMKVLREGFGNPSDAKFLLGGTPKLGQISMYKGKINENSHLGTAA